MLAIEQTDDEQLERIPGIIPSLFPPLPGPSLPPSRSYTTTLCKIESYVNFSSSSNVIREVLQPKTQKVLLLSG